MVPPVSLSDTTIQGNTWPKAVIVTANVAGTVYFAEGDFVVKTVSDITSAPSHRWAEGTVTSANTPTSIPIDVDALTNGYYRVFVANSQGVLSAPATNIVTISITRALTCATGGTCEVGETGPGGGVVFYVAASNFTSTGSDCDIKCKYLEAAPSDHSTGIVWATTATFCYSRLGVFGSNCQNESIYPGIEAESLVISAAATAIGKGMANTDYVYSRLTTAGRAETSTYAAGIAWAYSNNGKTDWHLPSKDALNELCKYARTQPTGDTSTLCTTTGPLRSGFSAGQYWSSSEHTFNVSWGRNFATGNQNSFPKYFAISVRPVRAF